MTTQRERILLELQANSNGITSLEAFQEFGVTRLSAIIYDLIHKCNVDIVKSSETVKNRYGEKVSFTRYKLREV